MTREELMKTPGTMLKEGREAKDYSLDDIATTTRISKQTLKKIESDRYEEYEATVFLRGHLRSYANEVGIDPDEVLRAFDRYRGESTSTSASDSESADGHEVSSEVGRRLTGFLGRIKVPHMVALALVLVAIFFIASYISGQSATATNKAVFSADTNQESWEMEKEAEETRWLLEKQTQSEKESE